MFLEMGRQAARVVGRQLIGVIDQRAHVIIAQGRDIDPHRQGFPDEHRYEPVERMLARHLVTAIGDQQQDGD